MRHSTLSIMCPVALLFLGLIAPLALASDTPGQCDHQLWPVAWIHRLIGLCSTPAPALHLHARPQ